jgi:hypothetical protein
VDQVPEILKVEDPILGWWVHTLELQVHAGNVFSGTLECELKDA